jgi:hypothetical protein
MSRDTAYCGIKTIEWPRRFQAEMVAAIELQLA